MTSSASPPPALVPCLSRTWSPASEITTVVPAEEAHIQVEFAFEQALGTEGLVDVALQRAQALDRHLALEGEDELTPVLLAVSDNGSQMISANTRRFMAMVAIAQHFGRPSTPTDQAWIESLNGTEKSLNGTVKQERSHLTRITGPAVLRAELEARPGRVQLRSAALLRLVRHSDDEDEGRGEANRQDRHEGLVRAVRGRMAYHRNQQKNQPNPEDPV